MLLNASKRERREERGGRGVNFYPTLPLTRNRVRSKFGNVMFHVTKFKLLNILVKWRCLHCTWKALFSKIKAFSLLKLFLLFSRVIFFWCRMNMAELFFCTQIVTITKIFLVENHLKIRSYTQWSEESENAFNEQFSEYLKVNHGYPSE